MSRLSRIVLATLTFAILTVATVLPAMAEEVQLNTGGTITVSEESTDVPIPNPGDPPFMYTTGRTNLLACVGACTPLSTTMTFSGGGITATSSVNLSVRQVPGSWATWSAPPLSEGAMPQVFYTQGATSLTLNYNQTLVIGGFELEPNPFMTLTYTAQFFNGATLVETVTRSPSGQAGALLFAIDNPLGFNRVVVTGPADFAIARLRGGISDVGAIPEPATMVLLGTGLAGLAGAARRRRKARSSE